MVRADQKIPVEVIDAFLGKNFNVVSSVLGQGNINDTYLVRHRKTALIIQRINKAVFHDPEIVAENAAMVSVHISEKLGEHAKTCFPATVQTNHGEAYCRDHLGGVWKAQRYLDATQVLTALHNRHQAHEIGRCLGSFHRMVDDLAPTRLGAALPYFHNLLKYLEKYDAARKHSSLREGTGLDYCNAYIDKNRERASFFEEARNRGDLQVRVSHGDPKVANVLFDSNGSKAVTLIDFDTVGPGLLLQDLGDCLRSCCSQSGEDDYAAAVRCDVDFAAGTIAGYALENELSGFEKGNLHTALYLITFELGLRFFTDYLLGNPYFKVQRNDDNLQRAIVQFKLATSIDDQQRILAERFASAFE